jgi:hypothetical protein
VVPVKFPSTWVKFAMCCAHGPNWTGPDGTVWLAVVFAAMFSAMGCTCAAQ